jgi:uncharacterized membrane protein
VSYVRVGGCSAVVGTMCQSVCYELLKRGKIFTAQYCENFLVDIIYNGRGLLCSVITMCQSVCYGFW